MTDIFFMPKRDRDELPTRLLEIPQLCEDLAITEMRLDRITRPHSDMSPPKRRRDSSRSPFNSRAQDAMDALHSELTSWVRLVTEHRALDYPADAISALGAARWLRAHLVPLALTPGSEEAYAAISARIKDAYAVIDLPPEDLPPVIPQSKIDAANRQVMTASQVEMIARRLGPMGKGLDRQRVYRLRRSGTLKPVKAYSKDELERFKLGDVLDAHFRHARRNRKSA